MIQTEFIRLFPNNVIRMSGNAGTFVFESEEGIMSIPEYDRTNDIPFEEQNNFFFVLMHWQGELETLGRGSKIANRCSKCTAIPGDPLIL